jgi:hypothetical protein
MSKPQIQTGNVLVWLCTVAKLLMLSALVPGRDAFGFATISKRPANTVAANG